MSIESNAAPAEAAAKEGIPMKAKGKTAKATAKKEAVKKVATPKTEKKAARKREPKEKVELRTLALRVTNQEFDLVHRASGPRGLSAFMKHAILTAAQKSLGK